MKKVCAMAIIVLLLPTAGFAKDSTMLSKGSQMVEDGSQMVKDKVNKAKNSLGKYMPEKRSEHTKEYMNAMNQMHKSMMKGIESSDPDIAFAEGMIPHHEGAMEMAKIELKYGKDSELRKLAQEIINAQDKEVVFMEAWLQKKKESMTNSTMK